MYGWDIKPAARNIAWILRDWMLKQETDKITVAVNKLSQLMRCGDKEVNSGLDELQSKGHVGSNRPNKAERRKLALADRKKKPGEARPRTPYWYQFHQSSNYKDKD